MHEEQTEYDRARAEHLNQYGYRVLQFGNQDVVNDLDGVLKRIAKEAALIP